MKIKAEQINDNRKRKKNIEQILIFANTLLRFKIIQYHPSSVCNNAADITKIEGIKS